MARLLYSSSVSFPFPSPRLGGRLLTFLFQIQVYASYLIFQLFSHKSLYDDETGAKPVTVLYPNGASPADMLRLHRRHKADVENVNRDDSSHESDVQHPELSWAVAIALLLVVTVFVGVTAEFLVDSIGGLADEGGISKEFIGLILLPIASNAAEHFTAVMVSVKDKLTLSLSVAVGSSIVSSLSPSTQCNGSTHCHLANRIIRHPIHRCPRMGHEQTSYHAVRSVRVHRTLPRCVDGQLRRARREIELAGRNDLDVLVRSEPY